MEKDITFLKNPKSFIDNLVIERNLCAPDVIKRVSTDGGDNSIKMIVNVFDKHQDPEILFPKLEKKGNLCSRVNQSIIMAYCEDLEENYNNLHLILELLQVLSSCIGYFLLGMSSIKKVLNIKTFTE